MNDCKIDIPLSWLLLFTFSHSARVTAYGCTAKPSLHSRGWGKSTKTNRKKCASLRSHNFISMRWKFYTCVSSVYDFPAISERGHCAVQHACWSNISSARDFSTQNEVFQSPRHRNGRLESDTAPKSTHSLLALRFTGHISTASLRQPTMAESAYLISSNVQSAISWYYIIFPKADKNFNANAIRIAVNQHSTNRATQWKRLFCNTTAPNVACDVFGSFCTVVCRAKCEIRLPQPNPGETIMIENQRKLEISAKGCHILRENARSRCFRSHRTNSIV